MFLSRRDGIYYLWYSDKIGKCHKVSTRSTTKSNALTFIKYFQSNKVKSKSNMMFSTVVLQFQAYARSTFRFGTCELYRHSFEAFIDIVGDRVISEITSYEIDTYKSKLCGRVGPVTVDMRLTKLKAVLNTSKALAMDYQESVRGC